jgi:hypothetical protein
MAGQTGCDQTEVSLKGQGKGRQRTVEGKREQSDKEDSRRERERGETRRRERDRRGTQRGGETRTEQTKSISSGHSLPRLFLGVDVLQKRLSRHQQVVNDARRKAIGGGDGRRRPQRRSGDLQDIQSAPWSPKRSKDQSYEVRRGHQKREAEETKRRDGLQGCRSDIPPCQESGKDLSHEVGDGAAIVEEEAPP